MVEPEVEQKRYKEMLLLNMPQIQELVKRLAREINLAMPEDTEHPILVLGILKGALFLTADLLRALPFDCDYNFITASSYVGNRSTTMVSVDLRGLNVKGKTVILVDEICDTGYTLTAVKAKMQHFGAKKVYTCVLLDKPSRREVPLDLDFIGLKIDDKFVIGYGLDLDNSQRTLPYIYYKERILTNREVHEKASELGLSPDFFAANNIDPEADYEDKTLRGSREII